MKKTLIAFIIILGTYGCHNNVEVDRTEMYYITNSLSTKISYQLIGISENRANQLGYKVEADIDPNSTVEVFKGSFGVGHLEIDSIKVLDINKVSIYKVDMLSFVNKSNAVKINEYVVKCTLDITPTLINQK